VFSLFSGLNENSRHIMDIKLEDIFEEVKCCRRSDARAPISGARAPAAMKPDACKPRAQNRAPAAPDARAPNPGARASSHLPEPGRTF
jgi:hypothetical protein